MKKLIFICALAASSAMSAVQISPSYVKNLKQSIAGALIYLEDMQIQARQDVRSCSYTYSGDDGELCAGKKKNLVGEWSSTLIPFPTVPGFPHKQDSNLFTTAGVLFSLSLFSDNTADKNLEKMKALGLEEIQGFKKNGAYNFWRTVAGRTSLMDVVAPLNINPAGWQRFADTHFFEFLKKIIRKIEPDEETLRWHEGLFDRRTNPYGLDSGFNIPVDADDTALAVAVKKLLGIAEIYDETALDTILKYRSEDSGAFLTWLKDDRLPLFGSPETGVIPVGKNTIDCVTNANAALAIGVSGRHSALTGVAKFFEKVVDEDQWPKCGIYYPNRMMFPYAFSRAYREGNLLNDDMKRIAGKLIKKVLPLQKRDGSFPGGFDGSRALSTAMGVLSLINFGKALAVAAGVDKEYDLAIQRGVNFLIDNRRELRTKNSKGGQAFTWDPGIYFSAGGWTAVIWKSKAYTAAVVLEALTKAWMHSENLNDGETSRKPVIESWANRADSDQFIIVRD
jgi:hypothetical protein